MNRRIITAVATVALAAVGITLLISYANGAEERANRGTQLESVLQVTAPIPANTKAADIGAKVESVRLPHAAIATGAIKNLAEVSGLSATTALQPGEQLLMSRFAKASPPKSIAPKSEIPAGTQELSIAMTAARAVAGTLKVGDKVGVIASYQTKEGDGVTRLIRNFVPITRITNPPKVANPPADGGSQMITIAVETRDAGKIINAIEFGKVWLTKQNPKTATGNGGSISRNDVTQ